MSTQASTSQVSSKPYVLHWERLCHVDDLVENAGVTAYYQQQQVAIFLLLAQPGKAAQLYAVDNHDPFSGANVISRGIVGDHAGEPVVASPLYKQHFRLKDGVCIEFPDQALKTWCIRVADEWVEISSPV